MVSTCLAEYHGMGQQQQQGTMFTGAVYAIDAALLMKMIYVSTAINPSALRLRSAESYP